MTQKTNFFFVSFVIMKCDTNRRGTNVVEMFDVPVFNTPYKKHDLKTYSKHDLNTRLKYHL